MNRNLVPVLALVTFLILACSFTSSTPTEVSAPPTDAPDTSADSQQSQDQMATFVAQTVEAQQPVATETPLPVEATPTPAAPALPNAPANFYADATCTKVVAHSYTVYKYVYVAYLHWDDSSDETSFELNKDGNLLATLDANTTEYKDTITISTPYKRYSANYTYTIQAVNAAGKSEAVEVFVTITCR
ncbi:MAG: hypothetical protein HYZ25_20845 [Chloroflexi bacterium]|nr:hypothetical protein [Chloroflexota bacterium]